MAVDEIKAAVLAGKRVHWANTGYSVMVDTLGQWLIIFAPNNNAIGLTHRDGVTLNGREDEFFIGEA